MTDHNHKHNQGINPIALALSGAVVGAGIEISKNINDVLSSNMNKEKYCMLVRSTALCSIICGIASFAAASLYNHFTNNDISHVEKHKNKSRKSDDFSPLFPI